MKPFADRKAASVDRLAGARPLPVSAKARGREGFRRFAAAAAFDAAPFEAVVTPIFASSTHLLDLACREPDVVAATWNAGFQKAWREQQDRAIEADDEAGLAMALRSAKRRNALIVALADLSGAWDASRVGGAMTALADMTSVAALDFAVARARQNGWIGQGASGLSLLAMGKHGAGELNYSSDIDLIALFDPQAQALRDCTDPVKVTTRIIRHFIKLMQDRASGGYVFRTDFRLRPDPGSMPLAVPLPLALNYYEARGQNWERAALIKARHLAGDAAVSSSFLDEIRPFIWRRYLDFAAIADIHSIKRQIQAHRDLGSLSAWGHDVKLGRGGIREIEFFVQTQQLIAGGRDEALRTPRTLDALAALADAGWIEASARDELAAAYRTLRDIEHRVQMMDDEQTHRVPVAKADRLRLCALCGSAPTRFETSFLATLGKVEGHYLALFEDEPDLAIGGNLSFTGADTDEGTKATLADLGYADPSRTADLIRGWHYGRFPAMQTSRAREDLTSLTPGLLRAFSESGRADEALSAFDAFLRNLPAGLQLFALLRANPDLLKLLVRILVVAPRLARTVARHPHVFDSLLEAGWQRFADRTELRRLLRTSLDRASVWEELLDRARVFASEQRFAIGARVLAGLLPPAQAGAAFTTLAEVCLDELCQRVRSEFAISHGRLPDERVALVAMGNLGTATLTATSDLDLLLVYQADDLDTVSHGARPLPVTQYYARLTQRLIAAMGAHTAEGVLFELDMRLRPSGRAGPLATRLSAFERYQADEAETWEHLALTRARAVAGDEPALEAFTQVRRSLLAKLRDRQDPRAAVRSMRRLLDREKPPSGPFDLKMRPGGLVDLEFLAQYAVLSGRAPVDAPIAEALDTLDPVPLPNAHVTLAQAHQTVMGVHQLLRLCLDNGSDPENWPRDFGFMVAAQLDAPDLKTASGILDVLSADVRKRFDAHMKAARS